MVIAISMLAKFVLIAMKSWQRKWDEDKTGSCTYEFIPVAGTRVFWPRKCDIGVSYGRMLPHNTMLKNDSYRTGTAESPMCECGQDNESVPHILLHCSRFVEARYELEDATEDKHTYAKSNCSGLDKVTFIISPPCDNNISKKDNICIKDALFQYISKIGMKL